MDGPHPVDELAEEFPQWSFQVLFGGTLRAWRLGMRLPTYLRARDAETVRAAVFEWERSWAAPRTYGDWQAAMQAAERITNGD